MLSITQHPTQSYQDEKHGYQYGHAIIHLVFANVIKTKEIRIMVDPRYPKYILPKVSVVQSGAIGKWVSYY